MHFTFKSRQLKACGVVQSFKTSVRAAIAKCKFLLLSETTNHFLLSGSLKAGPEMKRIHVQMIDLGNASNSNQ